MDKLYHSTLYWARDYLSMLVLMLIQFRIKDVMSSDIYMEIYRFLCHAKKWAPPISE